VTSRTWHTNSEEETIALGRELGPKLSGVVLLIGNLGAGKTTLTKGIAAGRGAAEIEDVSSPTFTLVHEYGAERHGRVVHIDLYRLDEAREVETLGLEDVFGSGDLVLIEWGERFPQLLPRDRTEIRISVEGEDSEGRTVEVRRLGAIASSDAL
jgi:tRNA threonylcarbamoyladenosine biosynthesis protein TsaE